MIRNNEERFYKKDATDLVHLNGVGLSTHWKQQWQEGAMEKEMTSLSSGNDCFLWAEIGLLLYSIEHFLK